MVSESSEGRALPQNVGGRYDASVERHLARLVTAGSMKESGDVYESPTMRFESVLVGHSSQLN